MAIYGFSPFGYEGDLITVETDIRHGFPAVDIVGLADSEVKGARERVRSAICNSGFDFPQERVLIGLSPADLKKEGAGFDLPMALSVLETKDGKEHHSPVLAIGELELNGNVRNTKGVYIALQKAVCAGIKDAIIPKDDTFEIPEGINVCMVSDLSEAYTALFDPDSVGVIKKKSADHEDTITFTKPAIPGLDGFKGHGTQKLAMAVAAAGRHNLLFYGAPGCGKSLLLQDFPELMPDLLKEEEDSVKRIYSITGLQGLLKTARPFRQPHQTASIEGMCGGGVHLNPGEISLAHNGVLFLDEAAEFRTSCLQMLRVPMETRNITLCRAGRTVIYPADFQLLMAASPCPCGNYGDKHKMCLCSTRAIELYWKKFSSPLLDRVEIRMSIEEDDLDYSADELREMIKTAWETQLKRQVKLNSRLTSEEVKKYCKLSTLFLKEEYANAVNRNNWSQRSADNVLKLARTVADMHGHDCISDSDLQLACSLHGATPLESLLD